MQKRTIFYFDDEAACVEVFAEIFGDDFDVRTAMTLSDARRMLAERPADVVISDQRMPEIDGSDFLREVAEILPSSYRVMLTGSAMISDVIYEISTGTVNLFVAKPWTEQNMRQMLNRAFASFDLRHKARQARAAQTQASTEAIHSAA